LIFKARKSNKTLEVRWHVSLLTFFFLFFLNDRAIGCAIIAAVVSARDDTDHDGYRGYYVEVAAAATASW
jgi:hypothetical protein